VLDWGRNLIESHAMEGTAPNAIDTALLKARDAVFGNAAMTVNSGRVFRAADAARVPSP
jgi:hypothetical protein